jgi:hypothetical protein
MKPIFANCPAQIQTTHALLMSCRIPEPDGLPRLRQKFEERYDGAHPPRIALDKLQALDIIRIIEGKA